MDRDYPQVEADETLKQVARQLVRMAIREDLERGFDLTTCSLVGVEEEGAANIVARQGGVAAGLIFLECILDELDARLRAESFCEDGNTMEPGDRMARLSGSARDLLTLERTLLNFIGRLSGIASLTRRYVDAIAGTTARIYDTRKTTLGWRRLEKYAVRCGGGYNHRLGLAHAVMIKDNHVAFAKKQKHIAECVEVCRSMQPEAIIEVEVDTLDQLDAVLRVAPDIVLLDNMDPTTMRQAVQMRDERNATIELEASGGIDLTTVRHAAESGVERISVGAITHSAICLDVALDWQN